MRSLDSRWDAGLRLNASEAAFSALEPAYNLQSDGQYPGLPRNHDRRRAFLVLSSGIRDRSDYGITVHNVAIQVTLTSVLA